MGVFLGIEEVGRSEVGVALGLIGIDAGGLYLYLSA